MENLTWLQTVLSAVNVVTDLASLRSRCRVQLSVSPSNEFIVDVINPGPKPFLVRKGFIAQFNRWYSPGEILMNLPIDSTITVPAEDSSSFRVPLSNLRPPQPTTPEAEIIYVQAVIVNPLRHSFVSKEKIPVTLPFRHN